MPYAVYLELIAPDNVEVPNPEKIPELIQELMRTGWEQPDIDPSGPRSPLEGEVVGHPRGTTVALALDVDAVEEALEVGLSLSRHLCDSAPATLGWQLDSIRAERLPHPHRPGQWLPDLD